jgi:hypothetical protein
MSAALHIELLHRINYAIKTRIRLGWKVYKGQTTLICLTPAYDCRIRISIWPPDQISGFFDGRNNADAPPLAAVTLK